MGATKLTGVMVQKYLAGQATWEEVTASSVEQWESMRASQK